MLDLLDYRCRIAEMYHHIRVLGTDAPPAHSHFRQVRNDLFLTHPQSPLDNGQKATFEGLDYFAYDPGYRVLGQVSTDVEPVRHVIDLGEDGQITLVQFGRVGFQIPTGIGSLSLFWLAGYGGGLFLPFRDATNGSLTYGGGRYLYDTIKGADLGLEDGQLVLDFNFAYNPSCHYNARWVCPLAPPENRLEFAISAGEMSFSGGASESTLVLD
jgi:uncharacterized protein (DUF1684 family)